MKLRLTMSRLAGLDLDELVGHIGEDDPRAALAVAARILDRIEMLCEQPEIGRKGRRPGTRELVVEGTRYIVAYRIDLTRGEVVVLRIIHDARQWPMRL